ncbi:MAG: amidohydrolase [Bacteroidota bacterium]
MQDLRITLFQSELLWEDVAGNLARFDEKLRDYKGMQDLILLPEMFNTGFSVEPEQIAESPGGPSVQWLSQKAKELDCVICGSLVIREGVNFYNRLVWMRPDGNMDTYDKRHLFRMADEHLLFRAGSHKRIVELNGWRICPLVCYDLRFPVWSKNTYKAGQYEYDVLIYIANWPEARNLAWKSLLMARAMENLSYVAGVNRVGRDGKGIAYSGDSVIIDPKGKRLLGVPANMDSEATISLNWEELRDIREKFNVGLDWDEFTIKF